MPTDTSTVGLLIVFGGRIDSRLQYRSAQESTQIDPGDTCGTLLVPKSLPQIPALRVLPPLVQTNLGYRGEYPYQANESKALSHYVHITLPERNVHPIAYIDFHSYSQEILYPFAYDCDVLPRDAEDLAEAAWGCAKAARNVHGRYFDVDSACEGDNFQSKVFDPCSLSLSLSASVFFV